jgi:hypothetical protein
MHMKRGFLKYALPVLGLVLGTSTAAHACAFFFPAPGPEVDPSLAIGAFTLLAGTLVVLRARRNQ